MTRPIDKVWKTRPVSREEAELLAVEAKVSPVVASVLLGRGLARDAAEVRQFLQPDIQTLPEPFLLKDMDEAVDLTRRAIAEGWPILVHGDRDVDGVAATSLLWRLLRDLGAEARAYVPGEVYGVATETIEQAAKDGVRLMILADCGTTAHGPIRRARELGIEVIVLDHHQPEAELPPASALINPKRADCPYGSQMLAGSGVSFKFAWALYLSFEPLYDEEIVVLDLETTGLEPESCEIVEIAALRFRRGLEREVFHRLVRPEKPIPPEVSAIHHISDEMVADSPPLEAVLGDLLRFLGPRTMVAHNAPFDAGFLDHACRRLLGTGFANLTFCTQTRAKLVLPGRERYSLSSLCRQFGIATERFHRAVDDARATGTLYYKLLRLEAKARRVEFYRRYLGDLTLGTLADVVPVLGENRVLCHYGLRLLPTDPRPGVRALCARAAPGVEHLSSRDVTFGIAPLLNAAGRAGKASLALRLLCTDQAAEANEILEEMHKLRADGRSLVQIMSVELRELLMRQADLERDRVLVVATDAHPHGVTGVVANRLMDEFGRPMIVLIDDGKEVRGSARAPEPFDILELLRATSAELVRFGGHRQAAGLSVLPERVQAFREAINRVAEQVYGDRPMVGEVSVDLELGLEQISEALVQELQLLEPFGAGNPVPVFQMRGVVPRQVRKIGRDEQHLRVTLGSGQQELQAVGWNFAERGPELEGALGEPLDLLFCLETNEYQGQRSVRLKLLDLRRALPEGSAKEKHYATRGR